MIPCPNSIRDRRQPGRGGQDEVLPYRLLGHDAEVLLPLADLSTVTSSGPLGGGGTNYGRVRPAVQDDHERRDALKPAVTTVYRPAVFFLSDGHPATTGPRPTRGLPIDLAIAPQYPGVRLRRRRRAPSGRSRPPGPLWPTARSGRMPRCASSPLRSFGRSSTRSLRPHRIRRAGRISACRTQSLASRRSPPRRSDPRRCVAELRNDALSAEEEPKIRPTTGRYPPGRLTTPWYSVGCGRR